MDCKDFENLLPLYHADELDGDDRRRVDAHADACADCRESLAFFAELETSLSERRNLRPHPSRTAARVIDQLGLQPRRSVFRSLLSLPGLASVALIVIGVFLLVVKNPFVELPAALGQMSDGFSLGLSPKLASLMNELFSGVRYRRVYADRDVPWRIRVDYVDGKLDGAEVRTRIVPR